MSKNYNHSLFNKGKNEFQGLFEGQISLMNIFLLVFVFILRRNKLSLIGIITSLNWKPFLYLNSLNLLCQGKDFGFTYQLFPLEESFFFV